MIKTPPRDWKESLIKFVYKRQPYKFNISRDWLTDQICCNIVCRYRLLSVSLLISNDAFLIWHNNPLVLLTGWRRIRPAQFGYLFLSVLFCMKNMLPSRFSSLKKIKYTIKIFMLCSHLKRIGFCGNSGKGPEKIIRVIANIAMTIQKESKNHCHRSFPDLALSKIKDSLARYEESHQRCTHGSAPGTLLHPSKIYWKQRVIELTTHSGPDPMVQL